MPDGHEAKITGESRPYRCRPDAPDGG